MRFFKSRFIIEQLSGDELENLEKDFRAYKSEHRTPETFGRDERYDHPHTLPVIKAEEVRHIHLADADTLWQHARLQYNKTSDSHLVYCRGFHNNNCYLLMAVLSPDAHQQAKDNACMYNLGKMAETFRQRF